jgi:YD repeat-containing protein
MHHELKVLSININFFTFNLSMKIINCFAAYAFKIFSFCLALSFLVYSVNAFGQQAAGSKSNGILPNVVPASPDASSLGKFGAWPVSQYTGIPNINIPLYGIKVKDFEVPISLSYHAGGIKVDEISSSVGIGWALSAGGVITRTIVGLPDEDGFQNQFGTLDTLKSTYDLNNPNDYVFLRKVLAQQVDTEPDIYNFNIGNTSGRFFTDAKGNFESLPVNNLKVLKNPFTSNPAFGADNLTNNWIISDANGNVYIFGSTGSPFGGYNEGNGVELSRTASVAPSPPTTPNVTAWYISKIILANRADTIYFDYTQKTEIYNIPTEQSLRTSNTSGLTSYQTSGNSWETELKLNQILYNGNTTSLAAQNKLVISGQSKLTKIRWRGGYVDFLSGTARQDMQINTGKMTDMISIYDLADSKLKTFNFKYTYIQKRYYLDTLIETGSDQITSKKHTFEYIQRESLPESRIFNNFLSASNAQDHWGFYNGATGNLNLLPPNSKMPANLASFINANREPNATFNQYGTLKKITYPTGGNTQFDYETNLYDAQSPIGGDSPPAPIITAATNVQSSTTLPYERSVLVTIPFDQNNVAMNINFVNYGHPPNKNQTWFTYAKIERQNGSTYNQVYYWDSFDNFPTTSPSANPSGLYDFNFGANYLSLTAGTYRITVNNSCSGVGCFDEPSIMPSASATLNYSKYGEAQGNSGVLLGGGLRIKKIKDYDHSGTSVSAKEYVYGTGKLLTYPRYFHQYAQDVWKLTAESKVPANSSSSSPYFCMTLFAEFKETTSSSQTILGITHGSSVGYQQVKENDINAVGDNNGYINYDFSFAQDSLNTFQFDGSYWSFDILNPVMPVNNFEYKRGLLLQKDIYKKNPINGYVKIYSLNNEYDFNDNKPQNRYKRIHAMRVKQLRFVDYTCGNTLGGYVIPSPAGGNYPFKSDIGFAMYDIVTSWVQQKSNTEIQYDENGDNPITTVTNYQYDNATHLQPTRIEKIRSDGKKEFLSTSYAPDYNDNSGFIKDMKDNYLIAQPIEEVKYLAYNGVYRIISGKISTFKTGGKGFKDQEWLIENLEPIALNTFKFSNQLVGNLPFVGVNTAFSNDAKYKTRLTYHAYDDKGNPLCISQENGQKITFLYSYNSQYPIVEIKNADYAMIESILGGSTILNNFSNSNPTDQQVRDFVGILRNSSQLKDVQITSYTYKPLVGITSITDAKGMTTYYEYDAFQRLKAVKDQNGNILKQTDYHYKN